MLKSKGKAQSSKWQNEIAQAQNADKLLGIVVDKKPRFEGLQNLFIPNNGRELIPGVVHTVKKCLLN